MGRWPVGRRRKCSGACDTRRSWPIGTGLPWLPVRNKRPQCARTGTTPSAGSAAGAARTSSASPGPGGAAATPARGAVECPEGLLEEHHSTDRAHKLRSLRSVGRPCRDRAHAATAGLTRGAYRLQMPAVVQVISPDPGDGEVLCLTLQRLSRLAGVSVHRRPRSGRVGQASPHPRPRWRGAS
jgi:hypothetical protein